MFSRLVSAQRPGYKKIRNPKVLAPFASRESCQRNKQAVSEGFCL